MSIDRRQFLQVVGAAGAVGMQGRPVKRTTPDSKTEGAGAIFLTDMSQCRPKVSLSRQALPSHWRLIDYETDTLKGVMIMAGQNSCAPDIIFLLSRLGWHYVYSGWHCSQAHEIFQTI